MPTNKPVNLKESLKNLNEIVEWFESQKEIDVEAGLEKVKRGAELVKACKKRLAEIENEFEAIKKDIGEDKEESEEDDEKEQEVNADGIPF